MDDGIITRREVPALRLSDEIQRADLPIERRIVVAGICPTRTALIRTRQSCDLHPRIAEGLVGFVDLVAIGARIAGSRERR